MDGVELYELANVSVRQGRLLSFKRIAEVPSIEPRVPIPFGSVASPIGHRFVAGVAHGSIEQLTATANGSMGTVQILPAYTWRGRVDTHRRGTVELEIWQLHSDVDRMRAMQIIMRSHYLNAPPGGLILGCKFVDLDEQERIREESRQDNPQDLWSEAWQEEPGEMIGCAVLGTLWHGQPSGRKVIAEREGRSDLISQWETTTAEGQKRYISRRTGVEALRLGYASRFAIDAPYRSVQLGTSLAKHLLEVAAHYRVPQAAFVEVITTLPKEEASRILESERDFLKQAGYTPVQKLLPSRPLLRPDPITGDKVIPATAKKLYYYAKVVAGSVNG